MKTIRKKRQKYPSDLTDKQWAEIAPLFSGMRVYKWSKHELMNAVLYVKTTGCQWRQLPHDFPPYSTVHSFYRRAKLSGLWEQILEHLVKKSRKNAGRAEQPSYAIIDSQSAKTTGPSEQRGIDGEKTKGRKRHIVVDTMGHLLAVVVHAANIHDTKSGIQAAKAACQKYPEIQRFCADAGYRGTFVREIMDQLEREVDISEKIKPHEWEKLPWRWFVERTLGWLNNSRRLSKDFEITTSSEEAFVQISHFHSLLKRL